MSPTRLLALWFVAAVGSLAFLPFLSSWLREAGWSGPAIAALIAVLPVSFTLSGPLLGWVADRTDRPDVLLRVATIVAAAGLAALWLAGGRTILVVAGFALVALGRGPVNAIGDAVAVGLLGGNRRAYGARRAWGSAAFLLAVLASGAAAERWPEAPIVVSLGLALLGVAVAVALPRCPVAPTPPLWSSAVLFARHPVLGPAVLLAVLHGATCSFYDDFFGVHVADAGFGPEVLGGALAVGVGVEVAVLAAGERLLARLGVGSLLVLGVGAGPIRWVVTAVSTSPLAIVAAQSLHGLTFASYWVAMVALFSERSPVGLRSAALGVLLGATFGVGRLAELVVAGVWLDRVGARALFLAFAGVSVFATWLALTVRGLDAGVESWAEE